jgi:hypothetical protein
MNGAEPPDRDLVTLVAEGGDETAFRLLYRRHSARLYRTALRLAAGDVAEALAIARTCPHLRHGGTVSVRPIEPT